jgi:hypothetical protein
MAGIDQTTASKARWYVTCSAKFSTDASEPAGGLPPRGSVGMSVAQTGSAKTTTTSVSNISLNNLIAFMVYLHL